MHAFLVTGKNLEEDKTQDLLAAKNKAKILPFIVQKIEDVRALRKLTKLSFSRKTAFFVQNIDVATVEAQNALLKSLEEPQENLIYILTAQNINSVMPTIVSRCEIVKPKKPKQELVTKSEVKQFVSADLDTKFNLIGNIKDRNEAIEFVSELIFFQRSKNNFNNMDSYLNTLKALKNNGNVSLQLTNMLISS